MTRPPRVLVVDDERPVRTFAEGALRLGGYLTVGAASGPEALTIAKEQGPFDLLLTDVVMPGLQGDELTQRLRGSQPELKVLYLTGCTDQLFDAKPILWENEAFVEKPVTVRGLLEAVSLMLYGHRRGLGQELHTYTVHPRSSRVSTAAHEVRVGDTPGHLVNVSASGALVRLARSLAAQQIEWPMLIDLKIQPVELRARVVRSREVTVPSAGARERQGCEVGLAFTELPAPATEALRALCADAFGTQE